ncbi:amidohydrolase family protein [uncultured Campylobacter sp.]|uniref:amidohydrolase family protein n=1 Tax=uncultured Campylobacter sp. TaxID=218934 RepID=UPI00260E0D74|nr:amidohydrolase family protein [uncultured Campylobacter sp.]
MFRDDFYRANERLDALGFSTNLIDGKTATNLARANAASFDLIARKTETNLTRTNLANLAEPSKQNARVNLSSNLRASETATSETLGFCQNASQIYAKDKFDKTSVNLTANEANSSGFSRSKFNEIAVRESELSGLQSTNLTQIKTVDIHSHLLSADVKFDRFYDKLALAFFAKKFDINRRELIKNGFEGYKSNFARLIKSSNFVQKSVVFGVDAKFDESGNLVHKDKTVCASNEEVFAFYEQNPNEVVPFFSVNPNRKDALNLIEKYHKMGFKGGKLLHSYWETDLNDKRYEPYFRLLSELGLPLVIHVGDENSLASNKALESIEQLKSPLNLGCRIVCAHMGASSDGVLSMFSRDPEKLGANYFTLLRWLREFDGLYADVSALLCINKARILPHLKTQTKIHDKILFGTDFPVPFSVILSSYDLPFCKRLTLNRIQNPLDRYVRAMSLYFGEDSPIFSNYKKILGEI